MLPKHVFLSYSTEDLERAKVVVRNLEQAGWSVWWDRKDIKPGDYYRSEIENALRICRCVVVLWSRQALASPWVTDEAETAHKRNRLVPVLLDDAEPPLGMRGLRAARLADWTGEADHPELAALHDAIALHAGRGAPQSQALEDAYFAEQRDIIAEHTRHFVGRQRATEAIDQFLRVNARGYAVIQSGPGQGKTALAAHLVKTLSAVHHFVSRDTYRSEARLIVRSLLAQLVVEDKQLPDSTGALTKLLGVWLARTAEQRGRVILVVDAVDELPSARDALDFLLLNPLPKGVFVVATGRPGDALDRVQAHAVTLPRMTYELDRLEDSEVGAILSAEYPEMTQSQTNGITRLVRGNPLLLRAIAADSSAERPVDPNQLPAGVDEYFRRALTSLDDGQGALLRRILGLLAVTRRPLSLAELSQITGMAQRELNDRAIRPLRAYLFSAQRRYRFYHTLFTDFVTQSFLYGDELARSHQDLAVWLVSPDCGAPDYRAQSLAYHLYHAGDYSGLTAHIDAAFLERKARELGYAVLEDVELLSRSFLDTADPQQLKRCLAFIEALPVTLGEDAVEEAGWRIRGARGGWNTLGTGAVLPRLPAVLDLEVYGAILPRGRVSADFVELFASDDRLFMVIGDAPGVGFSSAFTARFLANLARTKIQTSSFDLARALTEVRRTVESYNLFHSVTMQLVEIDPSHGLAAICNAGHPYPVKYSAAAGTCTRVPVQGAFLNPILSWSYDMSKEARHVEMDPGDVLVLYTDGLTDAGLATAHGAAGFTFIDVLRANASKGARVVGESILREWTSRFPLGGTDDAAIVVVSRRLSPEAAWS